MYRPHAARSAAARKPPPTIEDLARDDLILHIARRLDRSFFGKQAKRPARGDQADKRCAIPEPNGAVCSRQVGDVDWCFGCRQYVCEHHATNDNYGPSHRVEDHNLAFDDGEAAP
jgi:hypothetical protein